MLWKRSLRLEGEINIFAIFDIHVGTQWTIQDRRHIENTDITQIKYNSEKAYHTKYSKTKPP